MRLKIFSTILQKVDTLEDMYSLLNHFENGAILKEK